MKVFVDSNQFIADFLLESAPMRYLFHFLNNNGYELLLSRLVVQEVENKHREKVSAALADAEKARNQLSRLVPSQSDPKAPVQEAPPFDLLAALRERVEWIKVIEYDHIPHAKLVERALARRKPFDADGQDGYRDALIWLSMLDSVAAVCREGEEVAFISDNWSDFYDRPPGKDSRAKEGGEEVRQPRAFASFHGNLKDDLRNLKQVVTPFVSVSAFVDSKVDKTAHAVDLAKERDRIEEYVEAQGLRFLQNLDSSTQRMVAMSLFGNRAEELTITGSDAEMLEGLEDLDIDLAEAIRGELFVSCHFYLRGVGIDLHLPASQADLAQRIASSNTSVWDVVRTDDFVALRLGLKAYFSASFRLDPETLELGGFSVDALTVR
ncbi:hypothetical protein HNP55_004569 [Paucibacter oligotrophus]|uniref:DUF4935 domain-containing protein n=1 Tax=Roseateles oligotrophus TaxID=1769250 RepID=A0A840LG49_9BURK|nr:PIN domain-containing protein [Roseateles oligotrophus]MBB4846015.1 hypothetical protein [Roseateles oligotrophus]